MSTTTTRDEQSSLIVAHNETSFFSIRLAFLVYTRYTPRVKKRRDRKRTERLKKERRNAASSSAAERKIANILRHGRHRAGDELWLVVCVFWRTTTPSELFIPAEDEIRQQWMATLPRSVFNFNVIIWFHEYSKSFTSTNLFKMYIKYLYNAHSISTISFYKHNLQIFQNCIIDFTSFD